MNYRELLPSRDRSRRTDSVTGDIGHLLFVTARPGIQFLWAVLVVSTVTYTLVRGPRNVAMIVFTVLSFIVLLAANHYFPYDKYRPYAFLLLISAGLALITGLIYLTGGRSSLLGFLYFTVPIYAAAYYSYPGTIIVAALTGVVRFIPFMSGGIEGVQALSLSLSVIAYFVVGLLACYVIEGERLYARESSEFRHLLEVSRDREREISVIYNLSRKFSYTLDLNTILKTTISLARKMLAAEGALIFLDEEGRPTLKAALGTVPFSDMSSVVPPRDPWLADLEKGNPVTADRVSMSWLPLQSKESGRLFNIAAVPFLIGGEVNGFLLCFGPVTRGFRDSHLEILSTIASQAAIAIEKARLYATTMDDKAKVETILSALRDGLLVTDAQGLLLQVNPVAERMLGFDDSFAGKSLVKALESSIVSADLGRYTVAEALEAALEGTSIFGEMTLSGDTRVTVQTHFIPLIDQLADVSGVVLFLHDITELKRVDELKSNFVSNVSHELRTPLTSISGFVSLMLAGRAGRLTPQQEQYLGVVSDQTAHLTTMIEDLLDLSRIQARGGTIKPEKVDIREIVEGTISRLAPAAREKHIEIKARLSEGLPSIAADAPRICQVLTNIIDNAIKFTQEEGLVEISAFENGPNVQFQVSDNGIGIAPAALPHIFDRFFQAPSGDSTEQSGFGLGLAISREIVELHGGTIWVESEPEFGSTFCFTVPAYRE